MVKRRGQEKSDTEMYAVIINAAECGTECPENKRKLFREEKRCAIKDQIAINGITNEIICVHQSNEAWEGVYATDLAEWRPSPP
jgi:hypothetical protein